MTLVDLLAQDLLQWMDAAPDGVPRRVLLWLDPEGQFRRLAPHLEPILLARGAQLLCHEPTDGTGQLHLKLRLLRLDAEPATRAVVYLPGFDREALEPQADGRPPALWSVYDYRFKGCIWGRGERWEAGVLPELPTLYTWLRRHGLKVADEKTRRALVAGGADARLARYAERQRSTSPADWPQPLRTEDVAAALAGDPRDALRGLLAAPTNEVKRWGEEKAIVLTRVAAEFGIKQLTDTLGPEELADAVAVSLALTEAWEAFGRPPDFPYSSRLPDKLEHRARQVAFLRDDVLSHAELGPRFRERLRRLEASYPLADWARDRAGQPGGLPLLAHARWRRFLERLQAAAGQGWKTARELLRAEREAIHAAASAPWAHLDADTHWQTVRDLADLALQAESALGEAESLKRAAELVSAYADRWWRLDRLHLRVLAGAGEAHLEAVRQVADQAYFDCIARLADRFSALVEQEGAWPPEGTTSVATLQTSLWDVGGGRRGIIVTDACRWDLAQDLAQRLEGEDCSLTPVLTTLPSNTPFGMAALLPLADEPVVVEFGAGKPTIRQGEAKNLDTRDGRKAFLRARLADARGTSQVEFIDLEALLKGGKVPGTPVVVVLDNGIDEQGHKGTQQLPALVETFTRNLRRAIGALHQAGVESVHVVTDHGFLLLPPEAVDALGRPEVLPAQARYKHQRWAALKPDAPVADVMRLPAPLAPDVVLGIPRGVRTLEKAEPYLHGGISLQECVIPHLVSRRVLPRARLGLDLRVSSDRLVGGTVPVILRPRMEPGQTSLGGYEPIAVRLWVETVDAARTVAGPIELELRADVDELKPPLYLQEGLDLKAGQPLRLRALNAETGQNLGSIKLTLLVDWE
jgi:hypothetical protein